jgi:hypothetical protein
MEPMMNTRISCLSRIAGGAALALAAIAAHAAPLWIDSSAYEQAQSFNGQKTRAQVQAELQAAKRLPGWIDGSAYEQAINGSFASNASRDQVRAELQARGPVDAMQSLADGGTTH